MRQDVCELFEQLLIPSATTFRTIKLQPELDRYENDAEHSYLLATFGCALASRMELKLDLGKVSQYALVHDLVEVFAGDTIIWAPQELQDSKVERETKALTIINERFGEKFSWVGQTIEAYKRLDDPEGCFVYALDKIIPYVVMAAVDHQPFPSDLEVYEEKIAIARKKAVKFPALLGLFDDLDEDYRARAHFFKA